MKYLNTSLVLTTALRQFGQKAPVAPVVLSIIDKSTVLPVTTTCVRSL